MRRYARRVTRDAARARILFARTRHSLFCLARRRVRTARGARDVINGPTCSATPPLNPLSFEASPRSPNRLWVVDFADALPDAVGPCTLVDADGWANSGARVEGSVAGRSVPRLAAARRGIWQGPDHP